MKTVTLDVRPPAAAMADFAHAWKTGRPRKSAHISFATPELLWQVLTQKRWELLKVLCGAGPVSIRDAARRAGRDVKAEFLLQAACRDLQELSFSQRRHASSTTASPLPDSP
jgi:predicted transcriptional regulator